MTTLRRSYKPPELLAYTAYRGYCATGLGKAASDRIASTTFHPMCGRQLKHARPALWVAIVSRARRICARTARAIYVRAQNTSGSRD